MRKLYIIVSYPVGTHEGVITGVVANGTGRDATDEERNAVIDRLRTAGATPSLLDALREKVGGYHKLSVYDRRQAARNEQTDLNGCTSFFTWHIVEVGESIRKPVRKPLGWRIIYDNEFPSSFNRPESSADKRVTVDHAHLFNGDEDANYLFPARALAREELRKEELIRSYYSVVPVYADA